VSAALAQRIAQPDLLGLPDWQVAERLTAPDPALAPSWNQVAIKEARSVFRRTFKPGSGFESPGGPTSALVALKDAAADAEHPVRNVARAAIELFGDEDGVIDATDAEERDLVLALLGALHLGGILTEPAKQRIVAMMQRPQSWAEFHGVTVDARAVGIARGGV
jgi:hypothetical protein